MKDFQLFSTKLFKLSRKGLCCYWSETYKKYQVSLKVAETRLLSFLGETFQITVIPGAAERRPGIQAADATLWIPAFAGMTKET